LCRYVEAFEAEMETVLSEKKKGKNRPPRLTHLEESITRHHQHIGRLELTLRLIDNEALNPDETVDLKVGGPVQAQSSRDP
jgi:CCR4-NOT transcription complex subunit 3